MKFDPVNKFRSGKNKVENNAGQSGVPHILRSVPIRIVVITEDTRNIKEKFNLTRPLS